jgi:AraC-like DNA-binding protein
VDSGHTCPIGYVEHRAGPLVLWTRTVEADGSARILPDACWDLVWRGDDTLQLAGPDTRAWDSPVRRGETIVGVRFMPGTGLAAGLPLSEVRDVRIPFGRLQGETLLELAGRLLQAAPPDAAVTEAARRLAHPRQRVATLADDLGYSERQLRRRFLDAVGYGPKTLQRVLRFRRFLDDPDPDLAARAAAAGYVDQAHLTHECRDLAGTTPARLLSDAAAA